ncbi:MAG: hypothetical protein ACPGOY_02940 [Rhodospirillaceae bacterium]
MAKYEVQLHRDKRWINHDLFDHEADATKVAQNLIKNPQCEGVRVVYDRMGADGLHRERVVFEQMNREIRQAPVRIVPIDETNFCKTVEDVYSLESRLTLAKLLKKYLEQMSLTPSEMLFCYNPMARFMDADGGLLPSAVDRIVTLHSKMDEELDPKRHREEVYRWVDEIGRRSRRAEGEKLLRKVNLEDFAKLVRATQKVAFVPEEQDGFLKHVIARELTKERSFLGKLEVLLECVSSELSKEHLNILDGFIADVLANPSVVQDLLRTRHNLSSALLGLLDLMEGKTDTTAVDDEPEFVTVLRKMFSEGRLPSGKTVLMDRVCRELGGKQPLSRNDPGKEHEAFCGMILRLIRRDGVSGGPAVAGALTRRYGLRLNEGGMTGWKLSIQGVAHLLKDMTRRLHYLTAMSRAADGIGHLTVVAEEVVDTVKQARDIHFFVEPKMPTPEKLRLMTSVHDAVRDSRLPEVLRNRVCGRLDDLVARYLVDEKVVEKLDDPADSLRTRAMRLVKFCASGTVMEGKALQIARARVLHHLRQPNFVESFTSDVPDPREKEGRLRDFYRMLAEAGFQA